MNILFIGDITGKPGRKVLQEKLYYVKKEYSVDFTIANAENVSHGVGITYDTLKECEVAGIDFFTSGNHVFRQVEIIPHIEDDDLPLVRPANYPSYYPGKGFKTIEFNGKRILIVNLLGQVFMGTDIDNPYRAIDEILKTEKEGADISLVDIHAEATSEKVALGFYLDGRVNAVVGTHTHVQTADEGLLKGGTAYITDVGMTGPKDSVLWVKPEVIIDKALYPYRHIRYEIQEDGPLMINAVVIGIDDVTNKTSSIERVFKVY